MKQYTDISLKAYNSFGIDVKASRLIEYEGGDDLREIFSAGPGKWYVLSGGNNILFTGDYDGTLLHPVSKGIEIISENCEQAHVRVDAGVEWDDFVEWCARRELWGAENLSLIPGYVGAAPVQNIGAYGVEAKDILESVEMFCIDSGKMLTLARDHCDFGYRESVFKHTLKGKVIITSVNFVLGKIPTPCVGYGELNGRVEALGGPTLRNIRKAVIEIRESKLPDPKELGNAGSFFKNPVVDTALAERLKKEYPDMPLWPAVGGSKLAAGWLIDRCGWKGRSLGPAAVHHTQALVLVNTGVATGKDVLDLAAAVKGDVKQKFGIDLEMEVNIL